MSNHSINLRNTHVSLVGPQHEHAKMTKHCMLACFNHLDRPSLVEPIRALKLSAWLIQGVEQIVIQPLPDN